MAKPWGKYQIGYVGHPKFRALTGNAFFLWWEGKNYCDEHHTDGYIPLRAVKAFRFHGAKSLMLLTTSCGIKAPGVAYAPLWERLEIGGIGYVRMHDYLHYNDCRDEIQGRIADQNDRETLKKLRNKEAQLRLRAKRKAAIQAGTGGIVSSRHADVSMTSPPPPETVPATVPVPAPEEVTEEPRETIARTPERAAPPTRTPPAPFRLRGHHHQTVFEGSLPRDHAGHVFCSPDFTICVPAQVHAKFVGPMARRFGGDRQQAQEALCAWYRDVAATLPPDYVPGDWFRFWQGRFDAQFATPAPERSRAIHTTSVEADAEAVRAILRKQGHLP